MNEVKLRSIQGNDIDFLHAMFLETISWRQDRPCRTLAEVLSEPSLARYVAGWGRPGDSGVLALSEADGRLGAAWYRLFSEDNHGYGFVSPEIPELGIATVPEYRGRGLGLTLMKGLIQLATREARPALSLSVEEDNRRAIRLYESLGFKQVAAAENARTMLLPLGGP